MPLDDLPEALLTPTRDELVRRYERDYKLRRPGAKVGDKTQVRIDARVVSDTILPIYARADRLARLAKLEDMSSEQLEDEAERTGLPRRLPATPSAGFVRVSTSASGANVLTGDELTLDGTQLRFQFTQPGTYSDRAEVGISGISTGPDTNLAPGTVLKISNPRPGMGSTAVVIEQEVGVGLKGGHDVETDADIIERIREARANPPASGNDAEIQKAIRETPDVPVQAAFTWPAFGGPGTTCFAFTLRPAAPGGTRIPSPVQVTAVFNRLRSLFPVDLTILPVLIVEEPTVVALSVSWAKVASGWADVAPWPLYAASKWEVISGGTRTATQFRVGNGNTGGSQPSLGNTIAFYDTAKGRYRRKKIRSLTDLGSGNWDIFCETANNASDTSYTPSVGEAFCPWSDSLQSLVTPVLEVFDGLGPGEQFSPSNLFDEELRQRRSPPSPDQWPYQLSHRLFVPLYGLSVISDVDTLEPDFPYTPTIGLPGDSASMLTLGKLLAFPPT